MTWFELASPQKLTLFPCVRTTAATPSATISVNPDIASSISRVSQGYSRITPRIASSSRSSNFDGVIFGAPDRADNVITSYLQCQGVTGTTFDTEIKDVSGTTDATAHVIAAILKDNQGPASDFQYLVKSPIPSPRIFFARFRASGETFDYGGKYLTAARTSGGDAAGDWTLTFRRLTMGAAPVVALIGASNADAIRIQGQSVTTTSFRVRTSVAGTAANKDFIAAIMFPQQEVGRGSVAAPVLTPYRKCGLYVAYVSNDGSASVASPYDELFTVTRSAAGVVQVRFKDAYARAAGVTINASAPFAVPIAAGNVYTTTPTTNGVNVYGWDRTTGSATDADFILAHFSWKDETEY